ncbi:efflux RND transporter periplasmic adaptor subunit [Maridesulfovibrio sp.]|uniref:efflux RND transporter periplasmic adaptor subunit n=1 Tax=Maridesulfovibrio sp. TaxID=2795000 RepID=UPI002A18C903|nr:efflux RND transporter periplasmic adaptor subunit [Maridesulfovibrio sp.]
MPEYNVKNFKLVAVALVVLAVCALFAGCKDADTAQAGDSHARMVPVEVEEVVMTPFRRSIELPGRVSARRVAQVRARVAGIILSRDFQEGSHVTKGQVLFHIDPAQFQATLAQARADLARTEASMVDLRVTAERYKKLITTKSISQQEVDTAINNYKAALAAKNAAEAAVRSASLNLSYATVTAPISGRIGRALVTEGALVGEGEATHLATIQQLDPIYADINQPVAEYLKLKAIMNEAVSGEDKAEVTVSLDDVDYTAKGRLLFSDVTVDQETGQVSLRSEFPNKDGMLLPGMFVRIGIKLGKTRDVVFVPQRAVIRDADGSAHVFVVDEGNTVFQRAVKTGLMQGGRWQITEGLKPGDRLIINGSEKVHQGMTVSVKNTGAPAAELNAASGKS